MKKILLILIALFVSVIGYSQNFTDNYINYQITSQTNNTVRVYTYDTAGGTSVNIPATVINTSVTPNIIYDVTSIHQMAFMNKNISNVDLPSSLTSIGLFAFANNQLSSIVIPDSVTSIGLAAFENNQLMSANVPTSLTVIEDQVFRNNLLSTITIPNGVTSIGQASFYGNNFASITIPNSVTTISSYAFGTNPLTSVTSDAVTPPTITTGGAGDSFGSNRGNIDLTIPTGTEGTYVTDTGALWTDFNTVNGVSLSTSDFELANDIKVFSTKDAIKIIASNNIRLENYTVYSITGAKVATGSKNEIPTSFLSRGIYILKLDFDKGAVSKKVVIN